MKKIVFPMLIFCFFLDYSFFACLSNPLLGASFTLVMMAIIALERNFMESVGWAIFAGVLLDYVSSVPFGTNIFLFIMLVWIYNLLMSKLLPAKISLPVLALLFFGTFFIYEILKFIFLKMLVFLGTYDFDYFWGVEYLWQVLMVKISAILIGFMLIVVYRSIKKMWGIGKLEIKI